MASAAKELLEYIQGYKDRIGVDLSKQLDSELRGLTRKLGMETFKHKHAGYKARKAQLLRIQALLSEGSE